MGLHGLTADSQKSKIASHDPDSLQRFALESRRGEMAHWAMLFCFPVFYLWNPHWAFIVMVIYAVFANLPCIIVQHYNRFVILNAFANHCIGDNTSRARGDQTYAK